MANKIPPKEYYEAWLKLFDIWIIQKKNKEQ